MGIKKKKNRNPPPPPLKKSTFHPIPKPCASIPLSPRFSRFGIFVCLQGPTGGVRIGNARVGNGSGGGGYSEGWKGGFGWDGMKKKERMVEGKNIREGITKKGSESKVENGVLCSRVNRLLVLSDASGFKTDALEEGGFFRDIGCLPIDISPIFFGTFSAETSTQNGDL